jgi:D-alanine--poly(phosphoribitol) ligase subunit 1
MYTYNLGIAFGNVVDRFPENPALIFKDSPTVTYTELHELSNQFARRLLDMGVRKDDVLCISGEKSAMTFASILACLKLGVIYSILDADSPVERLTRIISACMPRALFVDAPLGRSLAGVCGDLGIMVIDKEEESLRETLLGYADGNLEKTHRVTMATPAYIMFTSGSTGFPKGAIMTHGNVLNLIAWSINTYGFGPSDVLTNVNPLYFDNSVFDLYSALFSGAGLVPFSKAVVTNPTELVETIDRLQCTSWFSVPSLLIYLDTMKVLTPNNMTSIKSIIFGGEGYPKPKLKRLYDMYANRMEIYNVYGPTECTCICSNYKVSDRDFEDLNGLPPLGRLIENFNFLILNDDDRQVADGKTGELCLMGPNVGKGYYNDDERTRLSFVQNPLNSKFKETIYRSGDLVRYDADDGNLYFVARKDNQVKHMGYRIELDEIESALNRLDYISESVVIHRRVNGISQIVAVVSGRSEVQEREVKKDLNMMIPDYMIPNKIVFMAVLPKNANGKIDRQRLKDQYSGGPA